MSAEEVGGAIG